VAERRGRRRRVPIVERVERVDQPRVEAPLALRGTGADSLS